MTYDALITLNHTTCICPQWSKTILPHSEIAYI